MSLDQPSLFFNPGGLPPTLGFSHVVSVNAGRLVYISGQVPRNAAGDLVGAFPDGKSALTLVATRLRHIASAKWGKRRYLAIETLLNPAKQEAAA